MGKIDIRIRIWVKQRASQENKIYRANKLLRDKIRQSLPKSLEKEPVDTMGQTKQRDPIINPSLENGKRERSQREAQGKFWARLKTRQRI